MHVLLVLAACRLIAVPAAAAPPRVVSAFPDNADSVRADAVTELRITFDQPMMAGTHSICGGGPAFPPITGPIRWEDATTVAVPVSLEPGRRYQLSINCPAARGFRSAAGESAEVYPITFVTVAPGGAPPSLTPARAAELTRALGEDIDTRDAHRDLRGVDWDAHFARHRVRLEAARTPAAFGRAAAELLRAGNDLHTWIDVGGIVIGTGRREVAPNFSAAGLQQAVPDLRREQTHLIGRIDGDISYLGIPAWSGGEEATGRLLGAVASLQGCSGLIIDVRMNSGGDETMARRLAACFVSERRVYSKSLIRDPGAPGGWAGPFDRIVAPADGPPRFGGRVAVLMGPVCMSSCESFLLMMHEPGRIERFGEKSWGSSGNPRPVALGDGVTVQLPSWQDLTPEGEQVEGRGVAPDHPVEWAAPGAGGEDPVLAAAVRWLRAGEPAVPVEPQER